MKRVAPDRLLLGSVTLVAAVATVGSLYFSEAMGLVPCDLCWVQRILMYPLVVVLGVATLEGRTAVWRTGLPLSLSGVVVAAYHSYLQLSPNATCTLDGGCTTILWQGFGVHHPAARAGGVPPHQRRADRCGAARPAGPLRVRQ